MTAPLTRQEFASAVADAVTGVLNVYREVDAMFRDLTAALEESEPQFRPFIKRLVPGSSKDPDARYLRNYQARLFVAAADSEDDEEDEDEDEGTDDDSDEEEEAPKRSKKVLTLKVGQALVVARAAVYDRARSGFEPTLTLGVLSRCRPDGTAEPGALLRTKASRFKRLFRAIDGKRAPGASLHTTVTAQLLGQNKSKNIRLTFDEVTPLRTYPLFDVTPDRLHEIVASLRSDWDAAHVSG